MICFKGVISPSAERNYIEMLKLFKSDLGLKSGLLVIEML